MMLVNFNEKFKVKLSVEWAKKYNLTPYLSLQLVRSACEYCDIMTVAGRSYIESYVAINAVRINYV